MTHIYYVRPDDVKSKTMLDTTVVLVNGIEMKYMKASITRMRGVEYDIYELVPIPRKIGNPSGFQRYFCCW